MTRQGTKNYLLRLPPELHQVISDRSEETGKSMNQVILDVLVDVFGTVEIDRDVLMMKKLEEISSRLVEIREKHEEELKKDGVLMVFYKCEKDLNPRMCLAPALRDFERLQGVYQLGEGVGDKVARFSSKEDLIRAVAVGDRYARSQREMNRLLSQVGEPEASE